MPEPFAPTVYLLEDNASLNDRITAALCENGFQTVSFVRASLFFEALKHMTPDLAVIEINFQQTDSMRILERLRANTKTSRIPVLLYSSRVGRYRCDANAPAAFPIAPLIEKVRKMTAHLIPPPRESMDFRDLRLDADALTLYTGSQALPLTPKAYALLALLIKRAHTPVSRADICREAWKTTDVKAREADVYVHDLRIKLADSGVSILTVRGKGYQLE